MTLLYEHYRDELPASYIREELDLTRPQLNYRFNQLEDMDYIDVSKTDSGPADGGLPERVASITDAGKRAVEEHQDRDDKSDGVADPEMVQVPREEFESMKQRLNDLETWSGLMELHARALREHSDDDIKSTMEDLIDVVDSEYVEQFAEERKRRFEKDR